MKIIISGYGKMGRAIEQAALARKHEIFARLDTSEDWNTLKTLRGKPDAVLEFSTPVTAVANIRRSFDLRLPVVVGTTGWYDQEELVRKWCMDEKQSIFIAANFSIGVNILFTLTHRLASLIDRFNDFDISIEEIHHIHKMDQPSGTAVKLAQIILSELSRKKKWVNQPQASPDELQIISGRFSEVFGIHTIHCKSGADVLTLSHEALSRQGFATGALLAAEWLKGKTGYFGMDDLLRLEE